MFSQTLSNPQLIFPVTSFFSLARSLGTLSLLLQLTDDFIFLSSHSVHSVHISAW